MMKYICNVICILCTVYCRVMSEQKEKKMVMEKGVSPTTTKEKGA